MGCESVYNVAYSLYDDYLLFVFHLTRKAAAKKGNFFSCVSDAGTVEEKSTCAARLSQPTR